MFSSPPCSRRLFGTLLGIILANVLAASAHASIFLGPGGFAPLFGTTAAAEPDLAAVILSDVSTPFTIFSASGAPMYKATLQSRVVRSLLTNHVHFSRRIRSPNATLTGRVATVMTTGYANWNCWTEYRIDGPGIVGPANATRSAFPGNAVFFNMPAPGLGGAAESRFMFLKTSAINWGGGGLTTIILTTGQAATIPSVHPVP